MIKSTLSKGKVLVSHTLVISMLASFASVCFAAYVPGGVTEGKASWYNGEGKVGAAGVKLHSRAAAHRTAPFYIWPTVVRTVNGDPEVDVEILDRGPFVSGVEIDLVKSAFQQIGNTTEGYINVQIFWP